MLRTGFWFRRNHWFPSFNVLPGRDTETCYSCYFDDWPIINICWLKVHGSEKIGFYKQHVLKIAFWSTASNLSEVHYISDYITKSTTLVTTIQVLTTANLLTILCLCYVMLFHQDKRFSSYQTCFIRVFSVFVPLTCTITGWSFLLKLPFTEKEIFDWKCMRVTEGYL